MLLMVSGGGGGGGGEGNKDMGRPSSYMLVLPADHAVLDAGAWRNALAAAIAITDREPEALVTLGVTPTRAATGFGYIVADGERVTRFTEKPDAATAAQLIAAGARWNAGTFVWRRAALQGGLQRLAPELRAGLASYEPITPAPTDTLPMEPAAAAGLVMTPCVCGSRHMPHEHCATPARATIRKREACPQQ